MSDKPERELSGYEQAGKPHELVATASQLLADERTKDVDVTEHLEDIEEVFSKLACPGMEVGMTSTQVRDLRAEWGYNELPPPEKTPLWLQFVHHLTGFFSLLLWVAAVLCYFAYGLKSDDPSNLYLGIVLTIVVLLTGCFSFYQDFKSDAVMAGFANFLPEYSLVVRDGKDQKIESRDLVPGDIVKVVRGDKIPADLRLITAAEFKVDNSSLTGESEAQARTAKRDEPGTRILESGCVAFYGTMAVNGKATGIVIRTGSHTVIGKIAKLASGTENQQTPINKEIHHFIKIVSYVAVFLGISFLIIGFIIGVDPVSNLVFAIGIIVANVPEGLLATVTVSLTLTAQRMAKKKVLVKNLEAVETLGSTTVIASDKTGTLTCNRMTVTHCFYDLDTWSCVSGHQGQQTSGKEYKMLDASAASLVMLQKIATLCCNAMFIPPQLRKGVSADEDPDAVNNEENYEPEDLKAPVHLRNIDGDASEAGFIKWAENLFRQMNPSKYPKPEGINPAWAIDHERKNNVTLCEIPFTSKNKYHLKICMENNDEKADRLLMMKGASERIVGRCNEILVEGKEVAMTDEHREIIYEHLDALMFHGERVLACAYRRLPAAEFPADEDFYIKADETCNFPMGHVNGDPDYPGRKFSDKSCEKLVFVGFLGLIDPPRPTVPHAVLQCQKAGIKVIMVTGDHPKTAEAIAKQVNIIRDETERDMARRLGLTDPESKEYKDQMAGKDIKAVVVTGAELADLNEKQLDDVLDKDQIVFARTSPAQKLIIVEALQRKKEIKVGPKPWPQVSHVVAVTGDGVNDSPALKAANIGVAMGKTGMEVAKNAADMILLNDNFASIVDGVEEGRLIFDNLKKSIAYTLSSNIPEISPFLVFILIQIPLPLPTVLILCIDLGTDMVPAISLAYENKEANIMEKPPRNSATDHLVTRKMISFSYLQIGVIQACAGFFSYIVVLRDYGFPPNMLPFNRLHFENDDGVVLCNDGTTNWENDEGCHNGGLPAYLWLKEDNDGVITYKNPLKLEDCNINANGLCGYPEEALSHAQCAFFISIIIVQWADIIACKTRWLSLKQQGMRNGMLNFGLFFETALGALLCYVPFLNTPLYTRPIHFVHWLPAIPFAIMIITYDETRKWLMRNLGKNNWIELNTYY